MILSHLKINFDNLKFILNCVGGIDLAHHRNKKFNEFNIM